jgi:hypothetical protein
MTDYYLDLSSNFADRSGVDNSTHCLLGPGGWLTAQYGDGAATPLAAGDTLYVKGTGCQKYLVKLTCTGDHATWAVGDTVRDNGGGAVIWQGNICRAQVGDNKNFVVQLQIGYEYKDVATANGIINGTKEPDETDTLTAKAGVTFDWATTGSAGSPITVIGVNASWAEDGTAFVLDGAYASGAPANQDVLYIAGGVDYGVLRNAEIKNAVRFGINTALNYADYWRLNRVNVHDSGSWNVYNMPYLRYAIFSDCQANAAASNGGFYRPYLGTILRRCVAVGNAGPGVQANNVCVIEDGVFVDNGTRQIYAEGTGGMLLIRGNVIDGGNSGSDDNIDIGAGLHTVIEYNRITNAPAGKYGVAAAAGLEVVSEYNAYDNNAGGDRSNVTVSVGDEDDQDGAPNYGYVSYVNDGSGDYSTDPDASMARVAVALPDGGNVYLTGGLTAATGGTYPAAANVWAGTGAYGPTGTEYTPAMHASDITVTNGDAATLTAPDIVDGVIVDDVTGTAEAGGSSGGARPIGTGGLCG